MTRFGQSGESEFFHFLENMNILLQAGKIGAHINWHIVWFYQKVTKNTKIYQISKDKKLVPELILFLSFVFRFGKSTKLGNNGKSCYHCPTSSWQNSSWPIFLWHFMTLFGKWSEKTAGSRRAWLIFSRLAPHLTKSQTNVNFLWPLITVLDRATGWTASRKKKMFIIHRGKNLKGQLFNAWFVYF